MDQQQPIKSDASIVIHRVTVNRVVKQDRAVLVIFLLVSFSSFIVSHSSKYSSMASPKKISIVCLPGDGVGPEVVGEAVKVLQKVAAHRSKALNVEFEFKNELIGLAALEKTGMYTSLATGVAIGVLEWEMVWCWKMRKGRG